MKLIYYQLTGILDKQLGKLSKNSREILFFQLVEEMNQCTDGFHDHVENILASFQK
ncbi:hypothetical protein [Coxiella-like endosymbiont]|uniref:hypothetical protein n=1 Tax=Coxiella-like endosymbiont TaxID=1592897 RepID=UPI00272C72BC|nr:hypothetical protein [Coxiella-like endosymbiont]